MKKYITPEMEIIEFYTEDVIVTSGGEFPMHVKQTASSTDTDDETIYDDPFLESKW